MKAQDLKIYHDHVDAMEKAGVDPEYVQGWQGGFLVNPKREEQRVNEAYEAGYDDGAGRNMDNYKKFAK
jgi:hypothetical protein